MLWDLKSHYFYNLELSVTLLHSVVSDFSQPEFHNQLLKLCLSHTFHALVPISCFTVLTWQNLRE